MAEELKPHLLVIVGPTATGKSALAVEAAHRLDGEVVSADSMQVYRGLDIGTGKVTPAEMRGVAHHLLDVIDPEQPFSVADYQTLARRAIADIGARGKLPILVGGTGLYVRAVVEDFLFPDPGADRDLRDRLQAEAQEKGVEILHTRLAGVDADAAARIHPNDVKRVIRALEVFHLTGEPISRLQALSRRTPVYDVAGFALNCDRERLYARIEQRVDAMMASGLIGEVEGLVERGLASWLTSVQAIGYKEFLPYLAGEVSLAGCVDVLKQETRRYAKRQLTWFRRQTGLCWLSLEDHEDVGGLCDAVLDDLQEAWVL